MRKLLVIVALFAMFFTAGTHFVSASENFTVQIDTFLDGENDILGQSVATGKGRGEKYAFNNAGISANYDFAFYAVNGVIRDDLPENYEFTVRQNMKITAIFHPHGRVAQNQLRHVVVFADSNGYILDVQYVAEGGNASDASITLPDKPNAVVATQRWKTSGDVTSLEGVNSNRVYYLQYELVGSVEEVELLVIDGQGSGFYDVNEVVTVTANPTKDGVPFSHFADENGHVLSTKSTYKFTMVKETTISAIYSLDAAPTAPLVNMTDTLNLRLGHTSYVGQFELATGYELVEYGFIISRSSDILTLDSLGATIVPSNVHNGQTGEFLRSFPTDTYNSVRAYLIVLNTVTEQTEVFYSQNMTGEPTLSEQIIYQTGFESSEGFASSNTYNNVPINSQGPEGFKWNFFYGTPSTTGAISGSQSAQMRVYSENSNRGYTEMAFSLNNVYKITFDAANTEGVNVNLYYSVDDGESYQLAQLFELTTSLANYEFELPTISNNVRFKFELVKDSGGTYRLYIDNVKIYSYAALASHEVVYNDEGIITTSNIPNGSTISYTPTKEGHTFNGWYLDQALTQPYIAPTVLQSLVLYAGYNINQYTLTFNTNGGSSITALNQDFGSVVLEPTAPTREGYTFAGWYTDNNTFNNEYSFETMPADNQTIFARWTANNYTITFDSNGGTAVTAITQPYQSSVVAPSNPTYGELVFQGWYTDDETFVDLYIFSTMPLNGITLYAKWGSEEVGPQPQGFTETFGTDIKAAYSNGTFTGVNGVVWTYVHARNQETFGIDGTGIMLRRVAEGSSLSATFTTGISSFSFEYRKAFTGTGNRLYSVDVTNNGETTTYVIPPFGSASGADATVRTFELTGLNLLGETTIRIYATGTTQATFDNFSWTTNPS